jgi:hypothetical protein
MEKSDKVYVAQIDKESHKKLCSIVAVTGRTKKNGLRYKTSSQFQLPSKDLAFDLDVVFLDHVSKQGTCIA